MDVANLTQMANDIAGFFETESGPEKAVIDVATHLKRFWDPRMRRELVAHFALGGAGLSPIARAAVAELAKAAHD